MIPPGRSDHEPCRPAGKAYGGPVSLSVVPQRLVSCYAMTRFENPSVVPSNLSIALLHQALTTYQRSTSAVQGYWQTANANGLHVQGAQFTAAPCKVTQEGESSLWSRYWPDSPARLLMYTVPAVGQPLHMVAVVEAGTVEAGTA